MFKTLYLGNLSGIRLYIHWSFWWLIAFVLLSGLSQGFGYAVSSVGFIFAIFGCVFLHELGHAFSGRWFGVTTRDITILPIGGLARMEDIPPRPWAEFVIAICGPLVNVAIALVLLLSFPLKFPETEEIALAGLTPPTQLFFVNVGLVVFNLLPVYPMDGGRVLRALLQFVVERRTAIRWTARLGQILAIAFVVYGLVTFQLSVILIFSIMFIACTIEMLQFNVREQYERSVRQTMGSMPPDWFGPRSRPDGHDRHDNVVDAEDVRRVP